MRAVGDWGMTIGILRWEPERRRGEIGRMPVIKACGGSGTGEEGPQEVRDPIEAFSSECGARPDGSIFGGAYARTAPLRPWCIDEQGVSVRGMRKWMVRTNVGCGMEKGMSV